MLVKKYVGTTYKIVFGIIGFLLIGFGIQWGAAGILSAFIFIYEKLNKESSFIVGFLLGAIGIGTYVDRFHKNRT